MTAEQAFDKAMEGRQYGVEERADAFAWFKAGWEAANEPVVPCRRCQRCGYQTSLPFTHKEQGACLYGGAHHFKEFPNGETQTDLEHARRTIQEVRSTPHLINGEFQSDKYPTTPRGKVPLSVKDVTAQDLLWEYAQRRQSVDAQFSDDLETALRTAGFVPASKKR